MNQTINVDTLSTSEKINLAEQLWESIEKEQSYPMTPQQDELLKQRISLHQQNPEDVMPWSEIRKKYL